MTTTEFCGRKKRYWLSNQGVSLCFCVHENGPRAQILSKVPSPQVAASAIVSEAKAVVSHPWEPVIVAWLHFCEDAWAFHFWGPPIGQEQGGSRGRRGVICSRVLFNYVNFGKMTEPNISGVTWLLCSLSFYILALERDLANMLFPGFWQSQN